MLFFKAYIVEKGKHMKVNVANYVYADLLKRFPLQNDQIVDSEVIDILLHKWANKEYLCPDSNLKLHRKQTVRPPHLI